MTASRLCWVLLALCILRLWVMPLRSSFWVDEMGTVFVVDRGASDPSLAVAPQVPQSIYYVLPRISHAIGGSSEIAWRIPSLLAMALALPLIAMLAARLIDPAAGWVAVFACLALRGFDYQAADARPYGLGTLVACAALYFLVRWLDGGKWPDALGFVAFAALLWWVHLAFWPFYFVFFAYMAARAGTAKTKQIGVVLFLLAIGIVPVFVKTLNLYHEAGEHVVVALPTWRDLAAALKFGLIIVCAAGAWFGSRIDRSLRLRLGKTSVTEPRPKGGDALILMLTWWLWQPVCWFAISWLTGRSVFAPRYLWLALPGAALTATLAASRSIPSKQWHSAAAMLGLGVLLFNGQWSQLCPRHHNSDWRAASLAIADLVRGTDTPVICPSPFVEARPPAWRPDYRLPGFLYAQLYVYPIPGRLYPFPFEYSRQAGDYAAQLARDVLTKSGRFVIYGGAGQVGSWREWFAARPELAGWRLTRLGPFADVDAVKFERDESAAALVAPRLPTAHRAPRH